MIIWSYRHIVNMVIWSTWATRLYGQHGHFGKQPEGCWSTKLRWPSERASWFGEMCTTWHCMWRGNARPDWDQQSALLACCTFGLAFNWGDRYILYLGCLTFAQLNYASDLQLCSLVASTVSWRGQGRRRTLNQEVKVFGIHAAAVEKRPGVLQDFFPPQYTNFFVKFVKTALPPETIGRPDVHIAIIFKSNMQDFEGVGFGCYFGVRCAYFRSFHCSDQSSKRHSRIVQLSLCDWEFHLWLWCASPYLLFSLFSMSLVGY